MKEALFKYPGPEYNSLTIIYSKWPKAGSEARFHFTIDYYLPYFMRVIARVTVIFYHRLNIEI